MKQVTVYAYYGENALWFQKPWGDANALYSHLLSMGVTHVEIEDEPSIGDQIQTGPFRGQWEMTRVSKVITLDEALGEFHAYLSQRTPEAIQADIQEHLDTEKRYQEEDAEYERLEKGSYQLMLEAELDNQYYAALEAENAGV